MKTVSVGEFLQRFESPYGAVTVREEATLREVMETMLRHHEQRSVFVVDAEGVLRGVIAVGTLARHLLHEGIAPAQGFSPSTAILHYLTAECAGDIMDKTVLSCTLEETLEEAMAKMLGKKLYKTLPVLDAEGHIVALLSVISILEFALDGGDGEA